MKKKILSLFILSASLFLSAPAFAYMPNSPMPARMYQPKPMVKHHHPPHKKHGFWNNFLHGINITLNF